MRQLPCSERRCDKRLFIRLGGGVTGDECIHRSGLSPYLQVLRARTLQPSLKDVNKRGRVVDAGEVRDKSLQRHQIEGKQLTDGRKEDQRPHLRNPSAASWIFSWRGRDQQSIFEGIFRQNDTNAGRRVVPWPIAVRLQLLTITSGAPGLLAVAVLI